MKNLKASEAVDCSTNFEILRYAQDDRERVLDDRECAQNDGGQCVVSEEILRYAQDDILHRLSLISTVTEFVVRVVQMWR